MYIKIKKKAINFQSYCRSDLIIPDYDDYYETWEAVILASTGSANVRSGPGTSYAIVTGSPYTNGTIIQVLGEVTGSDGYVWYHITVGNMYYGYIRSDLAEPSLSYIPWKVIANPPTANLNIRNGAGTNYALSGTISSVPKGKEMTVTGQTCGTDLNIWYKVYVDGIYGGYVRSDLVTPVMTKAYTEWTGEANSTTGTVNVRSEASTNSEVISGHPQMSNGDTCVVYGQVEGADGRIWYRVRILGQYFGYVRSDLISHQITSSSRLGYAKWNGILQGSSQNVNIRHDAGTGYAITAALPNGTAVEVVNTKNGTDGYVWYQVRTAEASGFARSDLVLHAGDTIGDNPYTILPWSGRCKTERQQFVYDAPFISLEGATVVKENSFFIILRKVFDRNGESWYHMRSEDGLTDGNGLLLVCYTKVNDVYTFPKAVDCDDDVNDLDGHSYIYPESDILQVCEKCGQHIIYKKPSKHCSINNILTSITQVSALSDDPYSADYQGRYISFPLLIEMLEDIEDAFFTYYCQNLEGPLSYTEFGRELIKMVFFAGRRNGYDTPMWKTFLLSFNDYSPFLNDSTHSTLLKKEIGLLSTYNDKDHSAIIDLGALGQLRWKHFIATTQGYYSSIFQFLDYWSGWGGDLAQLAGDVTQYGEGNEIVCASSLLGQSKTYRDAGLPFSDYNSRFSFEEIITDIDAIGFANILSNNCSDNESVHLFSGSLEEYYIDHTGERKTNILTDIIGSQPLENISMDDLIESIYWRLTSNNLDMSLIEDPDINDFFPNTSSLSIIQFFGETPDGQQYASSSAIFAVSLILAKYILSEHNNMIS